MPGGGAQVWMPHHRHLAEQKQGIIAARVDLAASATKARSPPCAASWRQFLSDGTVACL